MKTINLRCDCAWAERIPLGYQGESGVTSVVLDFAPWFNELGSGSLSLLYQRQGDSAAYPVTVSTSGTKTTWCVSSADTANAGCGKLTAIYSVSGNIKKSCVWITTVSESLNGSASAPSPWQSWVQQVLNAAEEAEAASEAIQDMSVSVTELSSDATPYVSKTTNSTTGAVTLCFGLPFAYRPVRGTDYWTAADIAAMHTYIDSAIENGAW